MMENLSMQTDTNKILISSLKIGGIIILGFLLGTLQITLEIGSIPLIASRPGNLGLLIILLTSLHKISQKNPTGWGFLSTYMYFSAYKNPGIMAWCYLILSGWALFTLFQWKGLFTFPQWDTNNLKWNNKE